MNNRQFAHIAISLLLGLCHSVLIINNGCRREVYHLSKDGLNLRSNGNFQFWLFDKGLWSSTQALDFSEATLVDLMLLNEMLFSTNSLTLLQIADIQNIP